MRISKEMINKYKKYNAIQAEINAKTETYRNFLTNQRLSCFKDDDFKEISKVDKKFSTLYWGGNFFLFILSTLIGALIIVYFVNGIMLFNMLFKKVLSAIIILVIFSGYFYYKDYKFFKKYKI